MKNFFQKNSNESSILKPGSVFKIDVSNMPCLFYSINSNIIHDLPVKINAKNVLFLFIKNIEDDYDTSIGFARVIVLCNDQVLIMTTFEKELKLEKNFEIIE